MNENTVETAETKNAFLDSMQAPPDAPAEPGAAARYTAYLDGMKAGVAIVTRALETALNDAGQMQAELVKAAFSATFAGMNEAATVKKAELEAEAGTMPEKE